MDWNGIANKDGLIDGREKRPSLWTDVDGNKKGTREVRDLFAREKVFDSPNR